MALGHLRGLTNKGEVQFNTKLAGNSEGSFWLIMKCVLLGAHSGGKTTFFLLTFSSDVTQLLVEPGLVPEAPI